MKKSLTLFALAAIAAPMAQAITLAEARALATLTPVTIDNVVILDITDTVGSVNSKSIRVRDTVNGLPWDNQTSATVFGSNAVIDGLLAGGAGVGDIISFSGVTGLFNGLFQIQGNTANPLTLLNTQDTNFTIVPVNCGVTDFIEGSATAEFLESSKVRMANVEFVDAGATFAGATNYTIFEGNTGSVARIGTAALDLVGQTVPFGKQDIIGLVEQFDTTDPRTAGYQVQMTSFANIVGVTAPFRLRGNLNLEIPAWWQTYAISAGTNNVTVTYRNASGTELATVQGMLSGYEGRLLADIPASVTSDFSVAIKFGPFLQRVAPSTGTFPLGDTNIGSLDFTTGDIDGDNEVGPGDFSALAGAFLSANGDPNFVAAADLDADGEVGPGDFSLLALHFLEAGDN